MQRQKGNDMGYSRGKKWTDKDRAYLRKHYTSSTSIAAIASHFGVSRCAVMKQATEMGIHRPNVQLHELSEKLDLDGRKIKHRKPWTAAHDSRVRELYGKVPAWDIAVELGRTERAIKLRASEIGAAAPSTKGKPFTWEEKDFVSKHYGEMTAKVIAEYLGRPTASVNSMARMLGMKSKLNPAGERLSDYAERYIRDHWPNSDCRESDEAIAKHLHKTVPTIRYHARRLGVRKIKTKRVKLGKMQHAFMLSLFQRYSLRSESLEAPADRWIVARALERKGFIKRLTRGSEVLDFDLTYTGASWMKETFG